MLLYLSLSFYIKSNRALLIQFVPLCSPLTMLFSNKNALWSAFRIFKIQILSQDALGLVWGLPSHRSTDKQNLPRDKWTPGRDLGCWITGFFVAAVWKHNFQSWSLLPGPAKSATLSFMEASTWYLCFYPLLTFCTLSVVCRRLHPCCSITSFCFSFSNNTLWQCFFLVKTHKMHLICETHW